MFGDIEIVNDLYQKLDPFQSLVDYEKWMALSNVGHINVAIYITIVAIFSIHISCTFLSLWFEVSQPYIFIAMGFVNNDNCASNKCFTLHQCKLIC